MNDDILCKSVISVTEMAKAVGLSRARFYQLVRDGIFPPAEIEARTGRPFYSTDKQQQCLNVRRTNCGINGQPILFYARRTDRVPTRDTKRPTKDKDNLPTGILDGLRALGLTSISAAQVQSVIAELYPNGVSEADQGEVIRAVFLRLRRQNSGDSVGR